MWQLLLGLPAAHKAQAADNAPQRIQIPPKQYRRSDTRPWYLQRRDEILEERYDAGCENEETGERWYEGWVSGREEERYLKPIWTAPPSGMSRLEKVAHHASCRDAVRVRCPICDVVLHVVQFCGGGASHYSGPGHLSCEHSELLAAVDEIELCNDVSRWVRLIVEYCAPHTDQDAATVDAFPGWPLQLDDASMQYWVGECVAGFPQEQDEPLLPYSKRLQFRCVVDSGPDTDEFEKDREFDGDQKQDGVRVLCEGLRPEYIAVLRGAAAWSSTRVRWRVSGAKRAFRASSSCAGCSCT